MTRQLNTRGGARLIAGLLLAAAFATATSLAHAQGRASCRGSLSDPWDDTCKGGQRIEPEPRLPTVEQRADQALNDGIAHYRAGRWAEAVAALQEATQWSPYSAPALEHLARSFDKLGQLGDALEAAGRWKLQPGGKDNAQAMLFWAYLGLKQLNNEWQEKHRRKVYFELADALDDIEQHLRRAQQLGLSRDGASYVREQLGWVRERQAALAPLVLEQARSTQAVRDAYTANDRGVDFWKSGNVRAALQEFEKAYSLYRRDPMFAKNVALARNELGRQHMRVGNDAAALEEFTKAQQFAPDEPLYTNNAAIARRNFLSQEGIAAFQRHDYAGALQSFQELLKARGSDADLERLIARTTTLLQEQRAQQEDGPTRQSLKRMQPSITEEVNRLADAWAQAQAAKRQQEAAARSGIPSHRPYDEAAGGRGDSRVVVVPARSWKPEPPERETPAMAGARARVEKARAEVVRFQTEMDQERSKPTPNSVAVSDLKQKQSKAEYEEQLAQRDYNEYRDRTAQKPSRHGPPPGFK